MFLLLNYDFPLEVKENEIEAEDNGAPYIFQVTGGYIPATDVSPLRKSIVSIRLGRQRKFFGDNHKCGGSIISKNIIITAAHCLMKSATESFNAIEVSVLAGTDSRFGRTENMRIYDAKEIKVHPDFNSATHAADIALIKLRKPIEEDGVYIGSIAIADEPIKPDENCIVYGWGAVHFKGPTSEYLVYTNVTPWRFETCQTFVPSLSAGVFCAGNKNDSDADTCQGDSGGPLVGEKGKLLGIISFGNGCGRPNLPGFYTDVHFFRNWILSSAAPFLYHDVILVVALFFVSLFL